MVTAFTVGELVSVSTRVVLAVCVIRTVLQGFSRPPSNSAPGPWGQLRGQSAFGNLVETCNENAQFIFRSGHQRLPKTNARDFVFQPVLCPCPSQKLLPKNYL